MSFKHLIHTSLEEGVEKRALESIWLMREFFLQAGKARALCRIFSKTARRNAEEYANAAFYLGRAAAMISLRWPLYPVRENLDWLYVPEDSIQMSLKRLSGYFRLGVARKYPRAIRAQKAEEFAGYAKKIDGILATLVQKAL